MIFLNAIITFAGVLENKKWTWANATYAPCENFGITGSYRVSVEAKILEKTEGKEISSLSLYLYSASFQNGEVTQTAKLTVKNGVTFHIFTWKWFE